MTAAPTPHVRVEALTSKAWPFEEARKVLARVERQGGVEQVIFETGFGPSGPPHIGTFGEVARTSMVRHAFSVLSDIPTKLICFSDDMDGMRKVPGGVPNQELLAQHLERSLTSVPDPWGEHESFGHHNNARLKAFLDRFGFEYEFLSATACYKSGRFNDALRRVLEVYDDVMDIVLPTLGEERRQTYSPFLPVEPESERVLQVPVIDRDPVRGTILYRDEMGREVETSVMNGHCKMQWKADWAMRWFALGVDYEMSGKDLYESVKISSRIVKAMGGKVPEGFNYELFLDEKGARISKTKGNESIRVDDWLRYAPNESLGYYMFQKPKQAKRLYFDVIPKAVDEYITFLAKYPEQDVKERLGNPVWHIHNGEPPAEQIPVSFNLLLNLVSASNAQDREILWGFINRYDPDASAERHPMLDQLVGYAINYYHDFVEPAKTFRAATDMERAALEDLKTRLSALVGSDADGTAIQSEVYAVGKAHEFEPLRAWFSTLYETLLGQTQGPRFGSFAAIYGIEETIALIDKALSGELAN